MHELSEVPRNSRDTSTEFLYFQGSPENFREGSFNNFIEFRDNLGNLIKGQKLEASRGKSKGVGNFKGGSMSFKEILKT